MGNSTHEGLFNRAYAAMALAAERHGQGSVPHGAAWTILTCVNCFANGGDKGAEHARMVFPDVAALDAALGRLENFLRKRNPAPDPEIEALARSPHSSGPMAGAKGPWRYAYAKGRILRDGAPIATIKLADGMCDIEAASLINRAMRLLNQDDEPRSW